MRELAFCLCLVIGFAGGAWVGSELASKSARDVIAMGMPRRWCVYYSPHRL